MPDQFQNVRIKSSQSSCSSIEFQSELREKVKAAGIFFCLYIENEIQICDVFPKSQQFVDVVCWHVCVWRWFWVCQIVVYSFSTLSKDYTII